MATDYVEYIDDDGVVESVDSHAGTLTVRITGEDECGSCPAARLCRASGKGDRTATVRVKDTSRYVKGQRVVLRGTERMHRKAIMFATVLPCIALIATMVLTYLLTGSESQAATYGICMTVAFFALLYLMRGRIAHQFDFEVLPADKTPEHT